MSAPPPSSGAASAAVRSPGSASPALSRSPTLTARSDTGATSSPPLFDYFVKLAFVPDDGNDLLRPTICAQFPEPVVGQTLHKDERALLNSLTHFVFPDADVFPKRSLKREERFLTFVLTAVSGAKRYGYCMRVLPQQSSKKGGSGAGAGVKRVKENLARAVTAAEKQWPLAYCVITPHTCAELFEQLLLALVPLDKDDDEHPHQQLSAALTRTLQAAHMLPLPRAGDALRVSVPLEGGVHVTLVASRASEAENAFDSCFVPQLLLALDALTLLHVYLALLLERRVIFVSAKPSVVAHSVLGASALITPFTWQHVFIPLLPASMLDMVCAPMPFVVGVLESMTAAMSTLPMEEVLFVDLDNQLVIGAHAEADPALLPPDVFDALLLALQRARSAVVHAYAHESPTSQRALPPPVPELRSLERELLAFQAALLGAPAWRAAVLAAGASTEAPRAAAWGRKLVQQLAGSQLFHMFTQAFCTRPLTDATDARVRHFDTFVDKLAADARLLRSRSKPTLSVTSSGASTGASPEASETGMTLPAPSAGKVDVVVKTGWLTKQGLKSQSWQLRYFVLTRTHLQYKKSKTDVQPQGVIVLAHVQRVENVSQGTGKEHCLALVTEARVYLAYAESAAQMHAWLSALRHRVQVLPELLRLYPTLAHEHEHWLTQGAAGAQDDEGGKDNSVMGNFATIGRSGMKTLLKSFKNNRPERDKDRDRDRADEALAATPPAAPAFTRAFTPPPQPSPQPQLHAPPTPTHALGAARAAATVPTATTSAPTASSAQKPATPPHVRQNLPTTRPKPLPRAPRAAHVLAAEQQRQPQPLQPPQSHPSSHVQPHSEHEGGARPAQPRSATPESADAARTNRVSALFDSLIDEVLTDLLAAEAAEAAAHAASPDVPPATSVASAGGGDVTGGVSAIEVDAFLDAVLNETQQLFAVDAPTPSPAPAPAGAGAASPRVAPVASPAPRLRAPLVASSDAVVPLQSPLSIDSAAPIRPSRFAPRLSEMLALSAASSAFEVVTESDGSARASHAALGSPRLRSSAASSSSSPSLTPPPSPRSAPRGVLEETWRLLWRLGRKRPQPPEPLSDEEYEEEYEELDYVADAVQPSASEWRTSPHTYAPPAQPPAYAYASEEGDVLGALQSPAAGANANKQRLGVARSSRERRHSQVATLLEMYALKLQQAEQENALHLQELQQPSPSPNAFYESRR